MEDTATELENVFTHTPKYAYQLMEISKLCEKMHSFGEDDETRKALRLKLREIARMYHIPTTGED